MATVTVRNAFRTELTSAFPAVQYVESIAQRVDNEALAELWHSLEFVGVSDGPIGIGNPVYYRETGTCRVWVGAIAGSGDADALAHAEALRDHFRRWTVPAAQLRVMSVLPPASPEDSDGKWFRIAVDVNYQRDYVA